MVWLVGPVQYAGHLAIVSTDNQTSSQSLSTSQGSRCYVEMLPILYCFSLVSQCAPACLTDKENRYCF